MYRTKKDILNEMKRLQRLSNYGRRITEGIDSINIIGDMKDTTGSLGKSNIRAINSEFRIKKIKEKWEKTPFDFVMYFMNIPTSDLHADDVEPGLCDIDWLKEEMDEVFPKNVTDQFSASMKNGNIVLLCIHNNDGMPYTPWIIAHRLGHAINDYSDCPHYERALDKLETWFEDFENYVLKTEYSYNTLSADITLRIGTMRSARESLFNDYNDFIHELFAQYLITGSIKFNLLDETFIEKISRKSDRKTSSKQIQKFNKRLVNLTKELPKDFNNSLNTFKGKILIV